MSAGRRVRAIGFYLSGHPLDGYESALKRLGAVTYAALWKIAAAPASAPCSRAPSSASRNAAAATTSLTASSVALRSHRHVRSDGVLRSAGRLAAAARSRQVVLLTVVADWMDDELKLRALSVSDLDKAAADAGEGLRIYLEDTRPLNAIAGQLRQAGKGLVTLVVPGSGAGSRDQTAATASRSRAAYLLCHSRASRFGAN
jgi:DNA polymerase-3 subunit alpha